MIHSIFFWLAAAFSAAMVCAAFELAGERLCNGTGYRVFRCLGFVFLVALTICVRFA